MTTKSAPNYRVALEAAYALGVGFLWGMALVVFAIGGIEGYKNIRTQNPLTDQLQTITDPAAQAHTQELIQAAHHEAMRLWGEAGITILVLAVAAIFISRWMNRNHPA